MIMSFAEIEMLAKKRDETEKFYRVGIDNYVNYLRVYRGIDVLYDPELD